MNLMTNARGARTMPSHRYQPFPPIHLPDRTWPNRTIATAPTWCSVDLRDGNQALIEPMDGPKKRRMFELLVRMGFKEIEVGFPAASQTDFDFVRELIEEGLVPDDVTIQVLTQSRPELIERTFEALNGARRAIVHLYNSTSTLQRRVVFGLDKQGTIDLALSGARQIRELAEARPQTRWVFQYSPESFTGTELDFARDICAAVVNVWEGSPAEQVIVNLPATVEMSTPNVYADMIEWMCRNLPRREKLVVSLHTHNDRGTGVAATEFGLMAGADRVEGTLFGNGERTGNVDIVTLALNMMTQGVDPGLDISDISEVARASIECTGMEIHPRHPYAGELALTAFSGSHQDAIKKGRAALKSANSDLWQVPYLPFDPTDIGRAFKGLVRINSQSGKGGVAYVMEHEHHLELPRGLQIDFSACVQRIADESGKEVLPEDLWALFRAEYIDARQPLEFVEHIDTPVQDGRRIEATIRSRGRELKVVGIGNGPIDAFGNALKDSCGVDLTVASYHEHAVSGGSDATAAAYVAIHIPGREPVWGVGMNADFTKAPFHALVSAVNRAGIAVLC